MTALPQCHSIELKLEDSFLHMTLNRPDVRNAITTEMIGEIRDVLDRLDEWHVRGLVLRGAGGNFCAGGDIKDMSARKATSREDDREFISGYSADAGSLYHAVRRVRQPVIGILEGACLGGGLGLACCLDVAIAAPSLHFGLPETRLGLVPAQVAPFVLRRLGRSYACMLSITGQQYDASWAQKMGLAHLVAESPAQVEDMLKQVICDITSCAPQAVIAAKSLMLDTRFQDSESTLQLGLIFARAMLGEEAKEGMTAFLEKRKPAWTTD